MKCSKCDVQMNEGYVGNLGSKFQPVWICPKCDSTIKRIKEGTK